MPVNEERYKHLSATLKLYNPDMSVSEPADLTGCHYRPEVHFLEVLTFDSERVFTNEATEAHTLPNLGTEVGTIGTDVDTTNKEDDGSTVPSTVYIGRCPHCNCGPCAVETQFPDWLREAHEEVAKQNKKQYETNERTYTNDEFGGQLLIALAPKIQRFVDSNAGGNQSSIDGFDNLCYCLESGMRAKCAYHCKNCYLTPCIMDFVESKDLLSQAIREREGSCHPNINQVIHKKLTKKLGTLLQKQYEQMKDKDAPRPLWDKDWNSLPSVSTCISYWVTLFFHDTPSTWNPMDHEPRSIEVVVGSPLDYSDGDDPDDEYEGSECMLDSASSAEYSKRYFKCERMLARMESSCASSSSSASSSIEPLIAEDISYQPILWGCPWGCRFLKFFPSLTEDQVVHIIREWRKCHQINKVVQASEDYSGYDIQIRRACKLFEEHAIWVTGSRHRFPNRVIKVGKWEEYSDEILFVGRQG